MAASEHTLRILGIDEDATAIVCGYDTPASTPTPGRAPRLILPIDDRLRAAVRGDIERLGQLSIEMASQLRPREIQERIRAGASVDQVAAAAGCPPDRIERYAYPVLMERATIADRARAVRPLAESIGPIGADRAELTLDEIVTATLGERGQLDEVSWDAFRDERGWTVTVSWRAGRSRNRVAFGYQPRVDGGRIIPRDAAAADLLDPQPVQLRTITGDATGHDPDQPSERARLAEDTVMDERAGAIPAVTGQATQRTGTDATTQPRRTRRGHRVPMPSWEDVLLGTRASER